MKNKIVKLILKDNNHILCFEMSSKDEIVELNLETTKDSDIKQLFNKLIILLKDGCIMYNFENVDGKGLFREVSEAYVKQLNAELSDIYEEYKEKFQ